MANSDIMVKNLFRLDIFKTIYLNFRFFPLKEAIKLPVYVFRKTKLMYMSGEIELAGEISRGILRLGDSCLPIKDRKYERTILDISGKLQVNGRAHFAAGSRISINSGATLTIGNNFNTTGGVTIACARDISFGNDCLLSWDITVLDSDFHSIIRDDKRINEDKPVNIGNHVWIGCGATILKGTTLADNTVIGANATVAGCHDEAGVVFAGNPAKAIRKEIDWKM